MSNSFYLPKDFFRSYRKSTSGRRSEAGCSLIYERLESREVLSANWAHTFGSQNADSGDDVGIGPDGSSYVVGGFQEGTIYFDDQSNSGEITAQNAKNSYPQSEGFLVKYDENGAFEWVVHAANDSGPATLFDVALDEQGNAYVVGHFFDEMTLYDADGIGLVVPETVRNASSEMYISKITSEGQIAWVEVLGGQYSQSGSIIRALEDDATGEVELIIAGQTTGGGDLDPGPGDTLPGAGRGDRHGFLVSYRVNADDSLALQWLQTRQNAAPWLDELSVSDNRITAIGFNESGESYLGVFNVANGNILLEQESGNPPPSGVATYGDSIYVSGNFTGSLDLDGNGTIDVTNDDIRRAYITKYTFDPTLPLAEQLRLDWATVLTGAGENAISDVKVAPNGDVYGAGRFFDTLSLDGIELDPPGEDGDSLVIELDPNSGKLLSAEGFGGAGHDRVRVMQVGPNGSIHLAGWTSSPNLSFPNISGTFTTAGGQDGFIAVYTPVTSAPPVADAGPPGFADEDQDILFDASSSTDPDGDPLTYRWDFGDGETAESMSQTISHAYAYGGTFIVTLTVLDGNGGIDSDTTTAMVTEINDAPVADAGGPYTGFAAQAVTFDASATLDVDNADGAAANDQILQYIWDFGDGGAASTTSATVEYAYAAAGLYNLTLTVFDGSVSSTATTTAAIEAAPVGDPNAIYVYDIRFESKRGSKDWRAVFEIRSDSDADGVGEFSDAVAADVEVTVTFAGQTYTGITDANGVFRTSWMNNLASGNYYANAVDLALLGYGWSPLDDLNLEDDSDGDGNPDQLLQLLTI